MVRPGGSTHHSILHGCDGGPESMLHALRFLVHPSESSWPYSFRDRLVSLARWAGHFFCQNQSITSYPAPPPHYLFPCSRYQRHSPRDHRPSFFGFLHPVSRGSSRILLDCIITSSNIIQSFLKPLILLYHYHNSTIATANITFLDL